MAWYLKIEVTLKTNKGTFQRVSGSSSFDDATSADLELFNGLLAYPDIRASKFRVFSSSDDTTYKQCYTVDADGNVDMLAQFDAVKAVSGNFAYAVIPNLDLTTQGGETLPTTTTNDRDPNRVLYTEAAQPHKVLSSAIYVSGADSNPVMRFEANTRPVSQGQYGLAPVLVLSRKSVQALQVDSSGVFVSLAPMAERGCISRYGSCNAEGLIFMASDDGVWTLSPSIGSKPVSGPIHSYESSPDILNDLSRNTALVYHDDGRGHSSVFVGTETITYGFGADYNMWYTLPRARTVYYADGTKLLATDPEGYLTEETREIDTGLLYPAGVPFYMKSATVKNGSPGFLRRLFRFAVRQRDGMDQINYVIFNPHVPGEVPNDTYTVSSDEDTFLAYTNTLTIAAELTVGETAISTQYEGSVVHAGVLIGGDARSNASGMTHDWYFTLAGRGKPGQGIEAIDVEYELRYDHRLRRRNAYSTMPIAPVALSLTTPVVTFQTYHDSIILTWVEIPGARYRVWWGTAIDSLTNVIDTGLTTATIDYEGDGTVIYFEVESYG